MIRRFLESRRRAAAPPASLPENLRVYAIGDIHGRLDLLDELLAMIDADDTARPPARTTLVFLGDLVDRGPDSAGVVERLADLADARVDTRFILGNHEEVFLAALDGDPQSLRAFCRIGGRETILSYGISPEDYEQLDYDQVAARIAALVPPRHAAFLRGFEDIVVLGDYAFVHAGVRPGVPLTEQHASDLRWIREPFLGFTGRHERLIVHGHTIRPEVETRASRIGIDTGAYASGRLTALGLQDRERWLLQTG